jgi:hypothetical protein
MRDLEPTRAGRRMLEPLEVENNDGQGAKPQPEGEEPDDRHRYGGPRCRLGDRIAEDQNEEENEERSGAEVGGGWTLSGKAPQLHIGILAHAGRLSTHLLEFEI